MVSLRDSFIVLGLIGKYLFINNNYFNISVNSRITFVKSYLLHYHLNFYYLLKYRNIAISQKIEKIKILIVIIDSIFQR